MGRYMRKCRGIGELAVMEVSQVVGVRTRARTLALAAAAAAAGGASSNRRKAALATTGEFQMAYLQLRSRSLFMKPRISRSQANSGAARCQTPERGRISRCSSNASCEVVKEELRLRSSESEIGEDLETAVCYLDRSRERRETTSSSNRRDESDDLESTAERRLRRSTAEMMPLEAEIEEFFAAAERDATQRFADKYNFDVVNEVPLEGRYEWIRVTP